jgi:hypothetical protein
VHIVREAGLTPPKARPTFVAMCVNLGWLVAAKAFTALTDLAALKGKHAQQTNGDDTSQCLCCGKNNHTVDSVLCPNCNMKFCRACYGKAVTTCCSIAREDMVPADDALKFVLSTDGEVAQLNAINRVLPLMFKGGIDVSQLKSGASCSGTQQHLDVGPMFAGCHAEGKSADQKEARERERKANEKAGIKDDVPADWISYDDPNPVFANQTLTELEGALGQIKITHNLELPAKHAAPLKAMIQYFPAMYRKCMAPDKVRSGLLKTGGGVTPNFDQCMKQCGGWRKLEDGEKNQVSLFFSPSCPCENACSCAHAARKVCALLS